MTRIDPVQPPHPPQVAERLDAMMPPGVPPILLFRIFVKNPGRRDPSGGYGSAGLSTARWDAG